MGKKEAGDQIELAINQSQKLNIQFFELMKNESIQSVFRSPKWQVKPKLHRYPPKRWGHTGVISKNKLYIYGGKTGKLKEPLYEIDCDTLESHIHELSSFPESRQSHSCSLIKDKLIIWGGCRQQKVLNDCISVSFKDRHCFWSQIAQFPLLKQRQSHCTTVLKQKFIVLYGGCNEDDIYEDFWVFNTDLEVWFEIKTINGKVRKRQNCTMTTIKDKIYMFGGQIVDGNYENQLYCLSFTDIDFSSKDRIPAMTCEKIIPMTPLCPQGRSSHAAISYLDRYLIIIAGESSVVDGKGKESSVLLNDVWCFDTQKCIWQPIDVPTKNLFKPRSCFSANLYRNKIYIFGGLLSLENYRSSDQLLILSFSQTMQKSLEVCNMCKLHYRSIEPINDQKVLISTTNRSSFDFNLRNLYKVSRMIKNPFDAFSLIVEGFYKMKYQSLGIDVIQGKIIMVQGLGREISQEDFQQIVNKYQFVDEINTDDRMILQALQSRVHEQNLQVFNFNLKNACSRLGIHFLLINRRGVLIDAMLVSPQSIHYCEFNTQDDTVGSQQERSAQIIRNYMHKNNLNTTLINPSSFTIIITDLQRISPTQSQLRVNGKSNVQLAAPTSISSPKKPHLQSYLSTYFLHRPALKLFINNNQINHRVLSEQYADVPPYEPIIEHDFKSIHLRSVQRDRQREEGFVYIYRDGLRVGKFVNGKSRILGKSNGGTGNSNKKDKDSNNNNNNTNTNYNGVEGYVQISLNYELNLLRFRVQNSRIIEQQLENICREFKEVCRKRGNDYASYQLEDNIKKL